MLKQHERTTLEEERRELREEIGLQLKWLTPIKVVVFMVIFYVATAYFGQSFDTSGIIALAILLPILNFGLPLYRLWRINKTLDRPRINTLN